MRKYDRYTDDFKKGIVALVKQGKTYAQVSKEYNVGIGTIGRWARDATEVKTDDGEILTAAQIKKLQEEKFALQEENEILKKALAIFTPHSKKG